MSTPLELHARLAKAEAAIVSQTRELAAIRAELAGSPSGTASDQRSDAGVAPVGKGEIEAAPKGGAYLAFSFRNEAAGDASFEVQSAR